jgi:outer membrane lipoprotein-sorting protein
LLGATLICGADFPVSAQPAPPRHHRERSAKSMLFSSMTRARRLMVSAVMTQRMFHAKGFEVEMKLEQDGEGRVKMTTVYPLRFQGMVSLDDGVVWKSYNPKERKVMLQPSPRGDQGNPFYQLALAEQNYALTMERSIDIADCPTVCVTATPKSKELSTRKHYLDARTSFMLRLEVVNPNGEKVVRIDTRAIAYVKSPPKMDLGDDGTARVESWPSPEKVWPPSAAKPKVGFVPVTPEQLPLGFIVRETQLVGGGSDQFIAVRITDGFVTATVYQWDKDKRSRHWPFAMKRDFRESQGIRMAIFGDMPKKALDTVLAGFCK